MGVQKLHYRLNNIRYRKIQFIMFAYLALNFDKISY